jgi:putative transposase
MPKTHCAAPELASLLDGSTAGELIPELARHGLQQLIELEVAAVIGADRHERTEERHGYRNGYRQRSLTTQVGDIDLLIPKLRAGSFLPSILEPRRRVDQALYAVIMEAYINGVSTRKVDALVSALGSQSGISKSQVSRICQEIDQQVQAFLNRPLQESGYAYVYMDATYLHGRLGKALQVCSRAVVVAMGVNVDGRRELLGLKVGDSESEGFWSEFIASLKELWGQAGDQRCPRGSHKGDPSPAAGLCVAASHRKVRLVISPAFISPEIFCSVSQRPIRAWSPLPCAACSPRRTQPISSAAGMIWPSHWRNASPKLLSS